MFDRTISRKVSDAIVKALKEEEKLCENTIEGFVFMPIYAYGIDSDKLSKGGISLKENSSLDVSIVNSKTIKAVSDFNTTYVNTIVARHVEEVSRLAVEEEDKEPVPIADEPLKGEYDDVK